MPVTLGLPLATARRTSTPPPGPDNGKRSLRTKHVGHRRRGRHQALFPIKAPSGGKAGMCWDWTGGLGWASLCIRSHLAGSTFMMAVVASASITTVAPPFRLLTSMREMAFHLENSIHLGSRKCPWRRSRPFCRHDAPRPGTAAPRATALAILPTLRLPAQKLPATAMSTALKQKHVRRANGVQQRNHQQAG